MRWRVFAGTSAHAPVNSDVMSVDHDQLDFEAVESHWLEATRLFEAERYSAALNEFKKLAEARFEPAFLEIGNIYELGKGDVSLDLDKAASWYRRSIESDAGHPAANLGLGRIYLQSASEQEQSKALEHFQSIKDREVGASFALGQMYEKGIGVSKCIDTAREYYEDAALRGHIMAQAQLIRCVTSQAGLLGKLLAWTRSRFVFRTLKKHPEIKDCNHPLVGVSTEAVLDRHNKSLNADASDAGAG